MDKILLIHGANLNFLGKRNPELYGDLTLAELVNITKIEAEICNFEIVDYQSNHEGDIVDFLQVESLKSVGIIINPGAFSHYSYAIYDALLDTSLPTIEVHLSNIEKREVWRRKSVTAQACIGIICGKKELGYKEAIRILEDHLQSVRSTSIG